MLCNPDKEAPKIMTQVRQHIGQHYHSFMDAVHQLQLKADRSLEEPITTNGVYLYYHPEIICILYANEGIELIAHGVMHLCAHCILGHLTMRSYVKNHELFDVLCDYKVHKMLAVLCGNKSQTKLHHQLKLEYSHVPLKMAYQQLSKEQKNAKKYLKYASNLKLDNHDLWNRPNPEENSENQGQGGEGATGKGNDSSFEYVTQMKWSEIKAKMAKENGTLIFASDSYGEGAGSHIWDYDLEWDSHTDYKKVLSEFLQKATKEIENPNTIDPMWYHYGLDYLDGVPLIEAMEEHEIPADGTLLIAIDTSGSCEGELCQRFLGELNQMMEDLNAMNSLNRIVLYQCDYVIHEELVMESAEDWKDMVDNFQLKGGGGTDFCPVFKEGEKYDDVVGLLYLSDGMGEFPEEASDYPTLFLITEDEFGYSGTLPDWVQEVRF